MDIFEMLFRGILVNTLGLYMRYFFFKLIGKKKTIKYLSGESKLDADNLLQSVFNAIIGMILGLPLLAGIGYIFYLIFK